MKIQQHLYTLLEKPGENKISYWLNVCIYILILISIVSLMLSTIDEFNSEYNTVLTIIKHIVMPIFIVEYIARLYASGTLNQYGGLSGKLRYMITPYAIIDLLSILPYLLIGLDLNSAFIRSLRLLRIFRLFRMKKYAVFAKVMQQIVTSNKEQFIVLLFYMLVIIILLSFIIFELEHDAQPEVFSNIFQTLWWSVATLTTVGYGDMYPITAAGKFATAIISIVGIAFIAIPGGIFASEFINACGNNKEQDQNANACWKCGSHETEVLSSEPTVSYKDQNKTFSELKHCRGCEQYWLN